MRLHVNLSSNWILDIEMREYHARRRSGFLHRRQRRRGRRAGPAPRALRLLRRRPRSRPLARLRGRYGLRRGRLSPALLERSAHHRRRPSRWTGRQQLRPRRRRQHQFITPRFCPRFHPSDSPGTHLDGVAADWPITYEDLEPYYEQMEREYPVSGPAALSLGQAARLPLCAAPGRHGRPDARSRAASSWASRSWPAARSPSRPARSASARTASCAASACWAARSAPRAASWSSHIPDAIEHGAEIRTRLHGLRDDRRRATAGRPASATTAPTGWAGDRGRTAGAGRSSWPATPSRPRACC